MKLLLEKVTKKLSNLELAETLRDFHITSKKRDLTGDEELGYESAKREAARRAIKKVMGDK